MVLIKAAIQEKKRIKGITCVNVTFVHHTLISFFPTCRIYLNMRHSLGWSMETQIKLSPTFRTVNKYNICFATEFQMRLILFRKSFIAP